MRARRGLAALAVAPLLLVGCADDDEPDTGTTTTEGVQPEDATDIPPETGGPGGGVGEEGAEEGALDNEPTEVEPPEDMEETE